MVNLPSGPIEACLYSTLTNNAPLQALGVGGVVKVFHRVAPEIEVNPFCVFQSMTPGTDVYTLSQRAYIDAVYKVEAYTRGPSNKVCQQLAEAIDTALTDQALTVTGWGLMYIRREQILDTTEESAGVLWNRIGALYRIFVRPS